MNRMIRTAAAAAAIAAMLSSTAFAAETRKEYRQEVAPVNAEISQINAELKALRAENKAASDLFRQIRLQKKQSGELSVSADCWSEAKGIRSEINEIGSIVIPNEMKNLRSQARTYVQEGDYDSALSVMKEALEKKQEQLARLKVKNELWNRINTLLQSGASESDLFEEDGSLKIDNILTDEIKDSLEDVLENEGISAGISGAGIAESSDTEADSASGTADESGTPENISEVIEQLLTEDITASGDSIAADAASIDAEAGIIIE